MNDESDHGFWPHYASLRIWCICRNHDGGAVESELVGHPIHWKSKTQSGVTTYKPDGTIEATVDGDKATYKGTWSIKDNKMCEKFGKEKCATINSLGGKKYSKGAGTFTVE